MSTQLLPRLLSKLLKAACHVLIGVVALAYWLAPIRITLMILVCGLVCLVIFVLLAQHIPALRKLFESELRHDDDRPAIPQAQQEFDAAFASASEKTTDAKTEPSDDKI